MSDRRRGDNDRAATRYDEVHAEIFNPIEQGRLAARLREAREAVTTRTSRPTALDYGCGTGNVTGHLLELGYQVTAADVSERFLDIVRAKYGASGRCTLLRLNGSDLELPLEEFDLVVTYSVLHHIPDYLAAVRRLVRALKPGGVLLIDHEASPSAWSHDPVRDAWHREGRRLIPWIAGRLREALTPNWIGYRLRKLQDPRATLEGDIHVWPDDHIDWNAIEEALRADGAEPVSTVDYLLYRPGYDQTVHALYRTRTADTRSLIVRKRGGDR